MGDFTQIIFSKSARELYSLLSLTHRDYPEFVFRGHGCASYELEPGIVRENKYVNKMYRHHELISDGTNYKSYEFELLRFFLRACDKTGIKVPGDSHELRSSFGLVNNRIGVPYGADFSNTDDVSLNPPNSWPDSNSFSLMVMVQHHGVPTRLLDWTASLMAAMYFASVGGLKYLMECDEFWEVDKKIAIWVLDGKTLNHNVGHNWFALIKPPASLSVNMVSQEGFFTTLIHSEDKRDNYILNRQNFNFNCLTKHELHVSQSVEMYEICKRHGYTGAKIYPGLDGAAKEANEMYMLKTLKQNMVKFLT